MGAREFTDAEERARRVSLVQAVGERVYGGSWQTPLADALSAATGRPLGRARVAQWMLADGAKPVPAWVLDALPAIAREGAARLRRHADELDSLFAEGGAGAPPDSSEPEAAEETPLESGPTAAAGDEEFDVDAFVEANAHIRPSRPAPEPAPEPAAPTGWRSRFAEEHAARWAPRNA
ncbi:hypothetical protein [Methylorubrum extorquens]|uniref:Uncharacterized protein n=1 Tax=Methylorubrum extorquens (strain ATCC 14718 / DSM 1338 / JCM 2805 / NCIMB 9133 / AM1) TaxID=272630 RepID=C5B669_METEA|nr:hypothetical protein [Methylorubrum extorquens]ACS43951.1 Hypothetical protein MexAM1_META2p1187 [Methylorubrum extorquens AM1]MCP1546196.1 hypothetical protein [Methylorubrum extorquens]MCP1590863.1 hypothetical protein [Methylorubrum extorquens]